MTLQKKSDGIYTDDSKIDILHGIDSVIFDCDGVLIDITQSYDQAIAKTTRYVLENFARINNAIDVDFEIIDGFKSTGGFNDEVDLTYAIILSLTAAKKLKKDQKNFVFGVIKNAESSGIISVEKYLENLVDISDIKKQLSYPDIHKQNPLSKTFDQLFYGPELYQKLFKKPSNFSESGLIQYDDLILDYSLVKKLQKRFDSKIAMVTGRGQISASYSLKDLFSEFDLKSSMFLEDEPRELAKPNPQSLLNCIKAMGSTLTLYVGDSMEDLIMAKKATKSGCNTIFCGIIGTSQDPQEKLKLFERNNALLVLDSIHFLPKILNLE